MIGGDRPCRRVSASLDRATGFPRLGWRDRSSQPAVGKSPDPFECLRSVAAKPDLERLLYGQRLDTYTVEHEAVELIRHRLASPPRAEHGNDVLDQPPPVASPDAERETLVRLVETG